MGKSLSKVVFSFWFAGACLLGYLAGVDLYPADQFLLAVVCLLLLIGLRLHLERRPQSSPLSLARLCLMVLAGFLALRYFFWRIQFSIPWDADSFSIACSLVLLAAEAMALVLYFLGMFVNVHPLWREARPVDPKRKDLPRVDVFVPSYNEDPELLRTTLLGCTSFEYPADKLRVYLLDDGGTDARCAQPGEAGEKARERRKRLQALCDEVGCHYLTRADNTHAKAGNLNAALGRTDGELVAVFDADHVPTRDFLVNTVGLMLEDDRRALVQTPHFLINRDPVEKNLQVGAGVPNEGEMFYTINLRGMDYWQAGFFCGSGALLRRQALEEIGGIRTETIVEDADTSMEMLRRGWRSAYLHRPMLAGLAAESLDGFFTQRTRWARGMIQLLKLRHPMLVPGLSLPQRLAYLNCVLYWIFSLAFLVFLVMPVVALLSGARVFAVPPSEILLYLAPHLAALFIVGNALYGRVRWPFVSEIYETLVAFFLPLHVVAVWLRPRKAAFRVTPKGEVLDRDRPSRLATPVFLFVLLQLIASVTGVYLIRVEEWGTQAYLTSLVWNAYNLLFTLAVLGVLFERRQRRARPRVPVHDIAQVKLGGRNVPCEIVDMNEEGASLRLPSWVDEIRQDTGELRFSGIGAGGGSLTAVMQFQFKVPFTIVGRRVISVDGEDALEIGVRFENMDIHARRAVVEFVYGHSERWRSMLKARNGLSSFGQGLGFLLRAVWLGIRHFAWRVAHPLG